ncbi:MAG: hypothetical protein JWL84_3689 [Rhodospirillales bacterium]|nr:hypothetical protein [Rhodospirillales bacterium]
MRLNVSKLRLDLWGDRVKEEVMTTILSYSRHDSAMRRGPVNDPNQLRLSLAIILQPGRDGLRPFG